MRFYTLLDLPTASRYFEPEVGDKWEDRSNNWVSFVCRNTHGRLLECLLRSDSSRLICFADRFYCVENWLLANAYSPHRLLGSAAVRTTWLHAGCSSFETLPIPPHFILLSWVYSLLLASVQRDQLFQCFGKLLSSVIAVSLALVAISFDSLRDSGCRNIAIWVLT